jgi:hypothetical protein
MADSSLSITGITRVYTDRRRTEEEWRTTREARLMSGIILITVPTIQYGGYFLLTSLMDRSSGYMKNTFRQNFFRAGHAHAGVIVILSLVCQLLADSAALPSPVLWLVRIGVALSAILISAGFFVSMPSADCHTAKRSRCLDLCRGDRVSDLCLDARNRSACEDNTQALNDAGRGRGRSTCKPVHNEGNQPQTFAMSPLGLVEASLKLDFIDDRSYDLTAPDRGLHSMISPLASGSVRTRRSSAAVRYARNQEVVRPDFRRFRAAS